MNSIPYQEFHYLCSKMNGYGSKANSALSEVEPRLRYMCLLEKRIKNLNTELFNIMPFIRDKVSFGIPARIKWLIREILQGYIGKEFDFFPIARNILSMFEDPEPLAVCALQVHDFLYPGMMFVKLTTKLSSETIAALENEYANSINPEIDSTQDLLIYVLKEYLKYFNRIVPLLFIRFPQASSDWLKHRNLIYKFHLMLESRMEAQKRLENLEITMERLRRLPQAIKEKILIPFHNPKSVDFFVRSAVNQKESLEFPVLPDNPCNFETERPKFTDAEIAKGAMCITASELVRILSCFHFDYAKYREFQEILTKPEDTEEQKSEKIAEILEVIDQIKAFLEKMQDLDPPYFNEQIEVVNNQLARFAGYVDEFSRLMKRYGQMSQENQASFNENIERVLRATKHIPRKIMEQKDICDLYEQYFLAYQAEYLKINQQRLALQGE